VKVSSSVLAASLSRIGEAIDKLDESIVDYIHLDIMDGNFVPPLTFGEGTVKAIKNDSNIPLDIHLMVNQPQKEVPKYFLLKPEILTFHIETTSFPIRLAQTIKEQGIKAGISLNPGTAIESLSDILPYIDLVLLMTVEPGYAGQKFLSNSYDRIKRLVQLRNKIKKDYGSSFLIEVDGGVTDQNIGDLKKAGVDIVVAGSFVFGAEDYNGQVIKLKEGCK
jgi:ribulose-phosphate 3-epimerase